VYDRIVRAYRQISTPRDRLALIATVFRHRLFEEDHSGRPRILDRDRLILCGQEDGSSSSALPGCETRCPAASASRRRGQTSEVLLTRSVRDDFELPSYPIRAHDKGRAKHRRR
jgi:hypothetical protein